MPARTTAVYSLAGMTFAICCKAGASLSLTLPCAPVGMFLSCSPRLGLGLCLCWQEAGAALGGVEGTASCRLSPVLCVFDANKARNPAWKQNSNRQEIVSYRGIFKILLFPLFFCLFFFLVVLHFWCGHVYSSWVVSMLLPGKLAGIPLRNPFLWSSCYDCPFPPFIFAFKVLTCADFNQGRERAPNL